MSKYLSGIRQQCSALAYAEKIWRQGEWTAQLALHELAANRNLPRTSYSNLILTGCVLVSGSEQQLL